MNYLELQLTVSPEFHDILTAELAEIGFESFVENEDGLNAYIQEPDYEANSLQDVLERYRQLTPITHTTTLLEKKNWNEEWEKSYSPIEVEKSIRIRASFHEPDPSFRYDLLINPKMSFGTGHHETTWLVMKEQLELPHTNARIMDVGCGTGILAILGAKLGAASLLAFDIDEWAVENTIENFELNQIDQPSEIFQGTISGVSSEKQFDGILANINRNILLSEIPRYVEHLVPGGWLVVSGFYDTDRPDIIKAAEAAGLQTQKWNTRNQWATVVFLK